MTTYPPDISCREFSGYVIRTTTIDNATAIQNPPIRAIFALSTLHKMHYKIKTK